MQTLLLFLTGLGGFLLFLRWREPRMIYSPDRRLDTTPDRIGLSFEDVFLVASDGTRIHGWWLPSNRSESLTILFLHGNAGNISHRLEKLFLLRELPVNVLIMDYRGYGRSEGAPNEAGTYADALAAYHYLTSTLHRKPQTIVVYGESLGSAVAVDLATRVPVGGVILEEAFTSVGDVAQGMFPLLPVRWLVRNKYDTLRKIGHIHAPLLMFHSQQDEMFSWRHAARLYTAAREPKKLVELRGSHNDAFLVSAGIYRAALRELFLSVGGESLPPQSTP